MMPHGRGALSLPLPVASDALPCAGAVSPCPHCGECSGLPPLSRSLWAQEAKLCSGDRDRSPSKAFWGHGLHKEMLAASVGILCPAQWP